MAKVKDTKGVKTVVGVGGNQVDPDNHAAMTGANGVINKLGGTLTGLIGNNGQALQNLDDEAVTNDQIYQLQNSQGRNTVPTLQKAGQDVQTVDQQDQQTLNPTAQTENQQDQQDLEK